MMFMNRFDHTMTASAPRAEAPSACAKTTGMHCMNSAIALILDATVVASIFVALISLISLLVLAGLQVVVLVSILVVLAVLLIANQLNRCKRRLTA